MCPSISANTSGHPQEVLGSSRLQMVNSEISLSVAAVASGSVSDFLIDLCSAPVLIFLFDIVMDIKLPLGIVPFGKYFLFSLKSFTFLSILFTNLEVLVEVVKYELCFYCYINHISVGGDLVLKG